MSARNTLENKRLRRAERSIRKPLPAYIDLVQWVKSRARISTSEALKIIAAGALRVDSHKIGVKEIGDNKAKVLDRYVPADLRGRISIVMPDELEDATR